jgi:hypothetical protein
MNIEIILSALLSIYPLAFIVNEVRDRLKKTNYDQHPTIR